MKNLIRIFFIYFRTTFSLAPSETTGKKGGALKKGGIVLLFVFVAISFSAIVLGVSESLYSALKPSGLQYYVMLNAIVLSVVLTFVFGFITALATYYSAQVETFFLSLPVKPYQLFVPKFLVAYCSEFLVTVVVFLVSAIYFGIREKCGISFYFQSLFQLFFLPVIPLSLAYIIVIPLMKAGNFFKKKDATVIIGGILAFAFAMAYQVFYQNFVTHMANRSWVVSAFTSPDSFLTRIAGLYYPATWAYKGFTAHDARTGIFYNFLFSAVSIAVLVLVTLLLSRVYANSLVGFDEIRIKRLRQAERFIAEKSRRGSAFMSFLQREIHLMNREPSFFLNGPFIILIIPIMLGILLVVQKSGFIELKSLFSSTHHADLLKAIGTAGMALFLGGSTSITATSLSREGKVFSWLKSLPIEPYPYFLAKLVHGLIFAFLGNAIGIACSMLLLSISFPLALLSLFCSFLCSLFLNLTGLFIDIGNPRLTWDNPLSALKQNPNSVIAIFICFGFIALFCFSVWFGGAKLGFGVYWTFGAVCVITAVVDGILLGTLKKIAQSRFYGLEK